MFIIWQLEQERILAHKTTAVKRNAIVFSLFVVILNICASMKGVKGTAQFRLGVTHKFYNMQILKCRTHN